MGGIPGLEHQVPPVLPHRNLEVLLLHDGGWRGHFHAERGEQRRRVAVPERRQREDVVDGLLANLAQFEDGVNLQAAQEIVGAETRGGEGMEAAPELLDVGYRSEEHTSELQ